MTGTGAAPVPVEVSYDPAEPRHIWLSWPGHDFPRADWEDNAGIILGWWCDAVASRLKGDESEELAFMWGPYLLVLGAGEPAACEFGARRRGFDDEDPEVVASGVADLNVLAAGLAGKTAGLLGAVAAGRDAPGPWSDTDLEALRKSHARLATLLA